MKKLIVVKKVFVIFLLCTATAIASHAQTFTTLHEFAPTKGDSPSTLIEGIDGNLYGTTAYGGNTTTCNPPDGCGIVFRMTPDGTVTVLHRFDGTNGEYVGEGLVQGTDGNFYGVETSGGANTCANGIGCGTVFKITPSGVFTVLHNFSGSDGAEPLTALVQGADGNLYGTTDEGGDTTNCEPPSGCGTFFRITPTGTLTTLHNFENTTDGAFPYGTLTLATDGNFYGATDSGTYNICGYEGTESCGAIYKISPSGTVTSLHNFDYTDGFWPTGLVQGTDGNFYGTTIYGGPLNVRGGCGYPYGCGTVYRITRSGEFTNIYNFCQQGGNCTDGESPMANLIQATDGNFYGTTFSGNASDGTVFMITSGGTVTTLYDFCSVLEHGEYCLDGFWPATALIQHTNGGFYGTTPYGGPENDMCVINSCGTAFSVSVGLGPFAKTQPASGKVGAPVKILGYQMTGATSVTFNGIPAAFTVVSSSLITTTVPAGATSGKVHVFTPQGNLSSNVPFRVTQ